MNRTQPRKLEQFASRIEQNYRVLHEKSISRFSRQNRLNRTALQKQKTPAGVANLGLVSQLFLRQNGGFPGGSREQV